MGDSNDSLLPVGDSDRLVPVIDVVESRAVHAVPLAVRDEPVRQLTLPHTLMVCNRHRPTRGNDISLLTRSQTVIVVVTIIVNRILDRPHEDP